MSDGDLTDVDVVTCFLRHEADVLLFLRSDRVGSYTGQWGTVAGHAEGDPDGLARTEISEETGLDPDADVTLVRRGEPFAVVDRDRGTRWHVHPYLFETETRDVTTDEETATAEWVPPTEILRRDTVPDLWQSYARVRPGVETVVEDRSHGSAWLSVRALEVLRDEAALAVERGGDWASLAETGRRLRDARPSMPVVANRVNRAMAVATGQIDADARQSSAEGERSTGQSSAEGERSTGQSSAEFETSTPRSPAALEAAATAEIDRALGADEAAAATAADRIGNSVATLSRSGTVLDAVALAAPERVLVAESRPGGEGVATAEAIAGRTDADVTVTTDAAFPGMLVDEDIETLVVGVDAVLSDGRVVNKVGTHGAATVAASAGVDCYAVGATDKVTTSETFDAESRDTGTVYDGEAAITASNPTFEAIPLERFDALVTEMGPLDWEDVGDLAETYRELAEWTA